MLFNNKTNKQTDRYINAFMVILCLEVRESRVLCIYIYIFVMFLVSLCTQLSDIKLIGWLGFMAYHMVL